MTVTYYFGKLCFAVHPARLANVSLPPRGPIWPNLTCNELLQNQVLFQKVQFMSLSRWEWFFIRDHLLNYVQLTVTFRVWSYSWYYLQWNPNFSNLQGKRKLVRKIEEFEKSGVKFQCLTEERERLLVRVIGRFEKLRVREIEIPLYIYAGKGCYPELNVLIITAQRYRKT